MAQPGDFAYTVKTSTDIVRIVSDYVRLKKASGSRYMGLCPFHQEKTPSFSVHGQFQWYHCFGCGAHGDVFKFVMEMERLTFPEAVRAVAEKAGIPVPARGGRSPENDPQARLRAQLFDIHERVVEFYCRQLEAAEGGSARQYLRRRGLEPEPAVAAKGASLDVLVKEFRLGYAPGHGQALVRLLQKDFSEKALLASGLVLKRDDGTGYFDRFRNRLIFPIHNEAGKPIAFGGRALSDEDQPKYLNSPETPIYRKSRVLFNFHRAREAMRRKGSAVLVEGYMDAMAVFGAGVHNVVASCGTSLTLQQVKNLAPLVKTVVVNYDPDSAGVAATERSLGTLLEENLEVRVLALPSGQDPDAFIRASGATAYHQQLEAAPQFFDYLVSRVPQMFDLGQPEGKAAAARHVLQYVSKLPDRIVRVEMADRLAGRLSLDRDLLGRELRSAAAERRDSAALTQPTPPKAGGLSQLEKGLLRLLVLDGEARAELLPPLAKLLEESPAYQDLPSRAILVTLASMCSADPGAGGQPAVAGRRGDDASLDVLDVAALEDRLMENDRQRLAKTLSDEEVEPLTLERARTCVEDLARRPMLARVEELRRLIRQAQDANNVEEAMRLLQEKVALEKELSGQGVCDINVDSQAARELDSQ